MSTDEPLYYIRDTRSVVGNSAMWWGPNGSGYRCNLDEAGKYTKAQCELRHLRRTDVPMLVSEADAMAQRHVDVQGLNRLAAKAGRKR